MVIIYVGAFTEAEIREILSELKKAVLVVTTGGKSYSFNDGMGSQTVTRSNLPELEKSIEYWEGKLSEVTGTDSNVESWGGGRCEYI